MAVQRFAPSVQSTANSSGTATFDFGAPPTSLVWEGSFAAVNATPGALWAAYVGGTASAPASLIANWLGNNVSPAVSALPGERLTVTAMGLDASAVTTLNFTGFAQDLNTWTPNYPAASPVSVGYTTITSQTSLQGNTGLQIVVWKVAQSGGPPDQVNPSPARLFSVGAVIQADPDNTARVNIGVDSTVGSGKGAGYGLKPGDTLWFPIRNANQVWFYGAAGDYIILYGA